MPEKAPELAGYMPNAWTVERSALACQSDHGPKALALAPALWNAFPASKVVRENAADEGNKTIVGRASEQCGEYKATFNGQDRVKGYFAVTWSHDDNYDIKVDSADLKLTIKKLKVGMKLDSEKTYGQLDDVVTGKGADWTDKTDLVWTEKDNVLTREMITEKIWGFDSDAEYNNVDVYISFIRKKLTYIGADVRIRAVRGVGYILETEK